MSIWLRIQKTDMAVIANFQSFMGHGLVCPPGKVKIEFGVAEEPGLFVECRASSNATPTWYLRLKNEKGTNVYKRLGAVRDISLTQARKLVKQVRSEHVLSAQVAVPSAVPSGSMLLDAFMRDHYFPHAVLHKRSAKKDEQLYRLHIAPKFRDMGLAQISRRDVQVFHNALLTKGQSPASADHSIKLMRRALNLAVQWEYLDKNVLRGIELFMVDNQVENYLDDDQLQRLLGVLRTDKNRMVCLILMFLCVFR